MSKCLCRKRVIEIDNEYQVCKECIKNELSGFADIEMCLQTNLIKVEVYNSDNN